MFSILFGVFFRFRFIIYLICAILCPGLELMKTYRTEVNRYESERQELANAEKLFDLPITMYPDLQQVQKQMKGLEMIYALYEEQLVSKKALS